MSAALRRNRTRRQRGFVLIAAALSMVGLIGSTGLAIDVGHIYVARTELQAFVDEAAVAAAFELDGSAQGLSRARDVALKGPEGPSNQWDFATKKVASVDVKFASAAAGAFESNPPAPAGYRFIRVATAATVPLYFLPVLPGIGHSQNVSASATACQCAKNELGEGLAPFSPTAHNPLDPDFGFARGEYYTLRWAPSGQRNQAGGTCAGDASFDPGDTSERGYVDVGQGTGAERIRDAIVNSSFFLPLPISVGTVLNMLGGEKSVPDAIETRFHQDTDGTALYFRDYKGNGRRLVTVAVNEAGTARVKGFGLFFLPPLACGNKNVTPCCAEYIGPAVVGSHTKGAGPTGLYAVQLLQ